MFRKFLIWGLVVCFVCSSVPMAMAADNSNIRGNHKSLGVSPVVSKEMSADSGFSVYDDAKFKFQYDAKPNTGNKSYTVTVTRRDADFDAYPVQFIYDLIIVSDNRVYTVAKYVLLKPGQKSVTVNENVNGEVQCVKEQSYGIKFPPLTEFRDDNSILDSAFNLKLSYYSRNWLTEKFRNPHIEYVCERRDHKLMDCNVVLKRAITLISSQMPPTVEWTGFGISNWDYESEGTVFGIAHLIGFQTHPDEYYIQFRP